jgi:dephospho-CoA kinase
MQFVVDRILVVDLDEIEQKQRLITRDNISNELAEAMIRNQCTRQQRLQFADDIIDNNGQESMLADQVLHLHQFYLTLTEQCH